MDQIIVDPNSVPKAVMTGAQYLVAMATSFALGRGWLSADAVAQIALALPGIVAVAWGIYKTWKNNEQKKVMADHVPDAVAVVK